MKADGEKEDFVNGTNAAKRVVNTNVAHNIMNPILRKVVTDGTGKNANLVEYDVAGKTGTSQKSEIGGRFSHDKFIGSFCCLCTSRRPTYLCVSNDQ